MGKVYFHTAWEIIAIGNSLCGISKYSEYQSLTKFLGCFFNPLNGKLFHQILIHAF